MTEYLEEQKEILGAFESGINRLLESNEDSTKVETYDGRFVVVPTKELNKMGYRSRERTIGSLTGLGVFNALYRPRKPKRLDYPVD